MPYFVCPSCGDQEKTIRMEIVEPYDYDVNAGGAPEITEVLCGCVLTPEQEDVLYVEAMGTDMHEWEPSEP
jgi:hypothetical protein